MKRPAKRPTLTALEYEVRLLRVRVDRVELEMHAFYEALKELPAQAAQAALTKGPRRAHQ